MVNRIFQQELILTNGNFNLDFLTWFEFAPEHTQVFDELLVRMRSSKEWDYVEREVEIRLERRDR